ncbi:MAG TPA: hypothetical protein V6C85_13970 [Allocoleopsis sp.]
MMQRQRRQVRSRFGLSGLGIVRQSLSEKGDRFPRSRETLCQ